MAKSDSAPFGSMIVAFCDGSCPVPGGPGGWGYVLLVKERQYINFGGTQDATNQTMELMAAIQTLRGIYSMGFASDQPVLVCSDSQYVVRGVMEWRKGWEKNGFAKVKNVHLWKPLFAECDQFDFLTFAWVKGHNGQFFNEMADKLAKKGRPQARKGQPF